MATRNLKLELEERLKAGILARHGPPKGDCTKTKLDEKTWEDGFVFSNSDGKKVYGGAELDVVPIEIDDGDRGPPEAVTVWETHYDNPTSDPQDFEARSTEELSVSGSWSVTWKLGLKIGMDVGLGGPIAAVSGFKANLKVEASVERGTEQKTTTETKRIRELKVPIHLDPGQSKTVKVTTTRSHCEVPFEMIVEAKGHVFFWAWWDNAGGRRWAGWPKEADYLNPFCGLVSSYLSDNDDERLGRKWRFPGVFKNTEYTEMSVVVEERDPVPVDPEAMQVRSVSLVRPGVGA